jgi:hypothetical protein
MTNVIVIVDPDYGDRLNRVEQLAPVWVVDTQINKKAFERLWKAHPNPDYREKGAITSFRTPDPEDRLSSLLGIMPELAIHHGDVEENELVFPKGFVLCVIGLAIADDVISALRELGFKSFIETTEGFEACK